MKRMLSLLLAALVILGLTLPAAGESIDPLPPMPRVTKDPTDEHVKEDGFCEFVSRADFAHDIIWHLISPDGNRDILAKNAPYEFPGVWVSGLNSETLGLDHIPAAMDGWHVRAEFAGNVGNLFSHDATIYLELRQLEVPTITEQPQSLSPVSGQPAVLEVGAATTEQAQLEYQWYHSTDALSIGGVEIPGATESTYTPEEIPGTRYYYCVVHCSDGVHTSSQILTQCVAVSYPLPTEPTTLPPTEPSTMAATEPSTMAVSEPGTLATVSDPDAPASPLAIMIVVVSLVLGILVVGTMLLVRESRRSKKRKRRTH